MSSPWRRAAPQLLLLSMIAIWGCSYASVKVVLDRGMPPLLLLSARFWIAVACLLPFALRQPAALRTERARGIATGTALLVGYALQTFGMQQTSASMGGFLSGLITLLVAVGAVLVFGERLRPPTVFGLGLGTVGLTLLCFGGAPPEPGAVTTTNTALGIGLQIASSCSYAAHILMLSRLSRRGVETQFCWWQLATVAIGVTLLMLLSGGATGLDELFGDPVVLGNLAFLGVFALALGIAVQSRMQPRIPASQVAVLFATQPGFAAIGGAVFLGERLTSTEWLGGAAIAVGVLVAELLRTRPSRSAPADQAAAGPA